MVHVEAPPGGIDALQPTTHFPLTVARVRRHVGPEIPVWSCKIPREKRRDAGVPKKGPVSSSFWRIRMT